MGKSGPVGRAIGLGIRKSYEWPARMGLDYRAVAPDSFTTLAHFSMSAWR
jgi:hypothetical protein